MFLAESNSLLHSTICSSIGNCEAMVRKRSTPGAAADTDSDFTRRKPSVKKMTREKV